MSAYQKTGGVAALACGATYLFGLVMYFAVLAPSGFYDPATSSMEKVAFLADNQATLNLWNLVIDVANSIFAVLLVLSLHARMNSGSPFLTQVAATFGLIWGGLLIAGGMAAIVGANTVLNVYVQDPAQAANLLLSVSAMETGLSGGVRFAAGLWVGLISWTGLRTRTLPRSLNIFGILIGGAGISTTIASLEEIGGSIFGLGMIVWFIWAGIVLLRTGDVTIESYQK